MRAGHRRRLGVTALVLWLGALGAIITLWASASSSGCVAPTWDACAVEDVRR